MFFRILNFAFLVPLLGLIALPLVLFSPTSWNAQLERRRAASVPGLPGTLSALKIFPQEFEKFFSDHFGLRRQLIDLRNQIDFWVLKRSPSEDVIIGKNNWLYYVGDHSVDDFRGRYLLTPDELARWQAALKERRDWLALRGIKYRFVIAPNKQSIYPEYLPDSLIKGQLSQADQLVAYMREAGDPDLILDLRPVLRSLKGELPSYRKLDVHWNAYGGYQAYKAILESFRPQLNLPTLQLAASDFRAIDSREGGEIAAMMGQNPYPWLVSSNDVDYRGPGLDCAHDVTAPPVAHLDVGVLFPDMISECRRASTDDRLVLFSDSMVHAIYWYLRQSFARSRTAWSIPTFADIKKYAEIERPTVVVEERVERWLWKVPPKAAPSINVGAGRPADLPAGGWVETHQDDDQITLEGWAYWLPDAQPRPTLFIDTNFPVADHSTLQVIDRPDVVADLHEQRLKDSGLRVRLYLDKTRPLPDVPRLCLWTDDLTFGRRAIRLVDHREWCPL
jgi:alginate O-acetyltransferase complex protein AlgJ